MYPSFFRSSKSLLLFRPWTTHANVEFSGMGLLMNSFFRCSLKVVSGSLRQYSFLGSASRSVKTTNWPKMNKQLEDILVDYSVCIIYDLCKVGRSARIRFHRKRYCFQWKRNDCVGYTHRLRVIFTMFSLETEKTQRKFYGFDENDMKTYSCRRALNYWSLNINLPIISRASYVKKDCLAKLYIWIKLSFLHLFIITRLS